MTYNGSQPDNGNRSRGDERQARVDALKVLAQAGGVPRRVETEKLAHYILTGEWERQRSPEDSDRN